MLELNTKCFLKAHNQLFWPIFLSATFYDLKVTFWYIEEALKIIFQNIHRKYEYFEKKH